MATLEKKKKSVAGSVTANKSKLIRAYHPPLLELIKQLVPAAAEKKDSKDSEYTILSVPRLDPELLKPLIKAMFKADHPYRTKLGVMSSLNTSGAGVLNTTFLVSGVSSVGEWGSIDALFDECFVHSMRLIYTPRNTLGYGSSPAGVAAINTVTSNSALVTSVGLIMVSLFNSSSTYSTAAGMLSNPTRAIHLSTKTWRYVWKNNVRFDPHGEAIGTANWNGWAPITSVSAFGGQVQIRAMNDVTCGDGTHLHTFGDYAVLYDVSFRSRA